MVVVYVHLLWCSWCNGAASNTCHASESSLPQMMLTQRVTNQRLLTAPPSPPIHTTAPRTFHQCTTPYPLLAHTHVYIIHFSLFFIFLFRAVLVARGTLLVHLRLHLRLRLLAVRSSTVILLECPSPFLQRNSFLFLVPSICNASIINTHSQRLFSIAFNSTCIIQLGHLPWGVKEGLNGDATPARVSKPKLRPFLQTNQTQKDPQP